MNEHHCLICSGSNYEYGKSLEAARLALKHYFPDILFGKEMETEAIGGTWLSPFGNQLAKFSTNLTTEEVRLILKQIEKNNGRIPEDKSHGIMKLDIDLLMYDESILKPDDMKRDFIKQGLKEL